MNINARRQIKQAIADCRRTGRIATRDEIVKMTGLKLGQVDDHVKRLKQDEEIRMVIPGVFEPCEPPIPDREVGASMDPSPATRRPVTLKVGETVVELTLREARNAGALLAGVGLQFRG